MDPTVGAGDPTIGAGDPTIGAGLEAEGVGDAEGPVVAGPIGVAVGAAEQAAISRHAKASDRARPLVGHRGDITSLRYSRVAMLVPRGIERVLGRGSVGWPL